MVPEKKKWNGSAFMTRGERDENEQRDIYRVIKHYRVCVCVFK